MRETNKVFNIIKTVTTEVSAAKEDIVNFSVDKELKTINAGIKYYASDGSIVGNESFIFKDENYLENPSESYIWSLIDRQREQITN